MVITRGNCFFGHIAWFGDVFSQDWDLGGYRGTWEAVRFFAMNWHQRSVFLRADQEERPKTKTYKKMSWILTLNQFKSNSMVNPTPKKSIRENIPRSSNLPWQWVKPPSPSSLLWHLGKPCYIIHHLRIRSGLRLDNPRSSMVLEYLPIEIPHKWPSFVGKYNRHGSSENWQ